MSGACTILIPTHNRARYLERSVRWFLEFDCPIVIADSSGVAWSSPLRTAGNVTYIHRPGGFEVYLDKLRLGLEAVTTPLVALCADDDFFTRDGFTQCAAFLQANPGYAAAQGYSYTFQSFGTRLVAWPIVYPFHNVHEEAWIDRIEGARSTIYYSVNRTAHLRDSIAFLARQDFGEIADSAAGLFDTALTYGAARSGKFMRLPVPFALREYSAHTAVVGTRHLTITSRNVPDFYKNLLEYLMQDSADADARKRLLKLFAADYSSQLAYDLTIGSSRGERLRHLSPAAQKRAELAFRCYTAARMYATSEYRDFLRLFRHPEYARIRQIVTGEQIADKP